MGASMMAEKKPVKRGPKAKSQNDAGYRTIGIRVSNEWAEWIASASKFDRMTIATFIDKAVADRAKAIGFADPPPERTR